MPIALKSLDEQVATDRTGDAAHHVLPGIVAVLQVGRDSDGNARCKTDPWLRECTGHHGSEPVVNAHEPGSCSTGLGDDGSSAPMAALARARMRSTAVTLFMKDGSPVGTWCCCRCLLLGRRIKTHQFGQRAGCPVHLSKVWVLADVLRLVEAVA